MFSHVFGSIRTLWDAFEGQGEMGSEVADDVRMRLDILIFFMFFHHFQMFLDFVECFWTISTFERPCVWRWSIGIQIESD